MKFCAHITNLPMIPQHFLDRAEHIAVSGSGKEVLPIGRTKADFERILTKDNKSYTNSRIHRYDVGEDFTQWVKENIIGEFREAPVAILRHRGPSAGPHSDIVTSFRLIYLITTGGIDCCTTWWHEKNKDLYPPVGHITVDYSNLIELEQIKMKPYNWYAIDTRVLHSVENITDDRIAVQISLSSCKLATQIFPEIQHWNDDIVVV